MLHMVHSRIFQKTLVSTREFLFGIQQTSPRKKLGGGSYIDIASVLSRWWWLWILIDLRWSTEFEFSKWERKRGTETEIERGTEQSEPSVIQFNYMNKSELCKNQVRNYSVPVCLLLQNLSHMILYSINRCKDVSIQNKPVGLGTSLLGGVSSPEDPCEKQIWRPAFAILTKVGLWDLMASEASLPVEF